MIGNKTKHAYLVVGSASSGTRFVTKLLIKAGCIGDAGHQQPFDDELPVDQTPVVIRRSYPHGDDWPDLAAMAQALRVRGYRVTAVVTVRDWWAVSQSYARVGYTTLHAVALTGIAAAYSRIFGHLAEAGVEYVMACYEALVARPKQAPVKLCELLGLLAPAYIEIQDGNAKYYVESEEAS